MVDSTGLHGTCNTCKIICHKGCMNLLVLSMAILHKTGLHSYVYIQYSDIKPIAKEEGFSYGINGQISIIKASHQVRGHWLWFDLGKNGQWQVYLPMTHYASHMWSEQVRYSTAQQPYDYTHWWWLYKIYVFYYHYSMQAFMYLYIVWGLICIKQLLWEYKYSWTNHISKHPSLCESNNTFGKFLV